MRAAPKVVLSDEQRAELSRLVRSGKTPVRLSERAQIVLRAADDVTNKDIAAELGIDWQRVARWRKRFVAGGLSAIAKDRPRGRKGPHVATPEKVAEIVRLTTRDLPPNATHWSTRTMAVAARVSEKTVRRVWHKNGLKPHLVKTFKVSNDPKFAEKLEDVVGLY